MAQSPASFKVARELHDPHVTGPVLWDPGSDEFLEKVCYRSEAQLFPLTTRLTSTPLVGTAISPREKRKPFTPKNVHGNKTLLHFELFGPWKAALWGTEGDAQNGKLHRLPASCFPASSNPVVSLPTQATLPVGGNPSMGTEGSWRLPPSLSSVLWD